MTRFITPNYFTVQSSQRNRGARHVAIIMDGNGRWAQRRGWPRLRGHRAGADAVHRVVEAAQRHGVSVLTLHAFSADNWKRPAGEVAGLFRLLREFLGRDRQHCIDQGIRVQVIGRRDRLAPSVCDAIEDSEHATAGGAALLVRIAIDYSARDAVLRAVNMLPSRGRVTNDAFRATLALVNHADPDTPPVDLLIRTGGDQRVSDLVDWDAAYAELYFTETAWPDFDAADFGAALEAFANRERRFGGLPQLAPAMVGARS